MATRKRVGFTAVQRRASWAFGIACVALAISIGGNFGQAIVNKRDSAREQAQDAQTCQRIDHLTTVTRRALEAAIVRAQAALPDPAAEASIRELRDEIKLLEGTCEID